MAKVIMIQGTASGVGKSTLVTGLCRIFANDGYKTAAFKAQNMTGNVHFLPDGLQIAQSQAIAAYACKTEPSCDMNPVLIKPAENGAELILNGRAIGMMNTYNYGGMRQELLNEIMAAYNRLYEKYDIIVVEGAGSPVEMNLKENDIVNMGFATRVKCPVLLAADIDRGGVFAALYGTVSLFTKEERSLVKGTVINRFMGDVKYFSGGREIIEKLTNLPVLGIIPRIPIEIEDEDAVPSPEAKIFEVNETEFLAHLEKQFFILEESMRKCLEMNKIYEIIFH